MVIIKRIKGTTLIESLTAMTIITIISGIVYTFLIQIQGYSLNNDYFSSYEAFSEVLANLKSGHQINNETILPGKSENTSMTSIQVSNSVIKVMFTPSDNTDIMYKAIILNSYYGKK